MKSFSVLMKPASGYCNMQCDYCFYRDEQQYQNNHKDYMSLEVVEEAITKFVEEAEEQVSFFFQGGEPLLAGISFFEEVISIQRRVNRRGIRINNAVQTNGLLINEEWSSFFRDNGILVGVSLDGIEETHDIHRVSLDGTPTYKKILNNIGLLKQYEVEFNILTVINRDTANHISEIFEEYRKQKFMNQQYIICRDPLGTSDRDNRFSVSTLEYGEFLVNLFDMWREELYKGNLVSVRQFENYIGILLGISPENCEQCGNCGVTYAMEANGDIYPCDFYMIDQFFLGNIVKDSISDIDKKRNELNFIKRSTMFSQKCRECKYLNICRNECQRNRIRDSQGNWLCQYCEGYYYFFSRRYEQMVEIAKLYLKMLNIRKEL